MTAGYGMVPRGAFYAPPGLRPYGSAGQTDPIAALIGNALGAFQGTRTARQQEADRQDALQRQDRQESDMANWRDLQTGIGLAGAGLTTTPPPPTVTPGTAPTPMKGFGTPGMDIGTGTAPTSTPASPLLTTAGGQNLYRAGPTTAERTTTETDARNRTIHQRIGHVMAQQLFGHDVDDLTAEGLGASPQSFVGLDKNQQPKYTPVDMGAGSFDPRTGTTTPTDYTPTGKPPNAVEEQRAASVPDMVSGAQAMREILQRNPSAASGAYNKLLFLAAHPVVGSLGLDAARSLGLSSSNDDERNFMTAAEQYMNGKLGLTAGSRITEAQYRLHLAPVIPSATETPGSLQNKIQQVDQSVRSRVQQTGRAFRDAQYGILAPEAQQYLRGMGYDPQVGGFGATPAAPTTPTVPGGPPKGLAKFLQ